MSAFIQETQKAVYDTMAGTSPPLAAGGVFDYAPETVTYPFIQIGDSQVIPNDASNTDDVSDDGVDSFLDVHVWSRYRGAKEVNEITSLIYTLFHNRTLTISGRASALCWIDSTRIVRDPDGITRHGVSTLRITHRS